MSQADLRRVQSDLDSMQLLLGLRVLWTMADVWLHLLLGAACGLFAAITWPGSPVAVPFPWAAAPIYLAIAVLVSYMAFKSRTLPRREEPRKREYQTILLGMGFAVVATLGYQSWSRQAGLGGTQAIGALFTIFGVGLIGWPLIAPAPHRYPRSYYFAAGIPGVVFGASFPFMEPSYRHVAIGLLGLSGAAAQALVIFLRIRQLQAEEETRVVD